MIHYGHFQKSVACGQKSVASGQKSVPRGTNDVESDDICGKYPNFTFQIDDFFLCEG